MVLRQPLCEPCNPPPPRISFYLIRSVTEKDRWFDTVSLINAFASWNLFQIARNPPHLNQLGLVTQDSTATHGKFAEVFTTNLWSSMSPVYERAGIMEVISLLPPWIQAYTLTAACHRLETWQSVIDGWLWPIALAARTAERGVPSRRQADLVVFLTRPSQNWIPR
jgi:hypothetical protein